MRVTTTVEIDEEDVLEELSTSALVAELERRQKGAAAGGESFLPAIDRLHYAARYQDQQSVQRAVSDLLYETKGVIV